MFGAVKVSGVKEKSKKSKHRHHHHHRERDAEAEPRDDSAGLRDSESSKSEGGPKRDQWMTGGSADPTADRLAAMFEIGKMAVPRMERKAAERRAERERLRKESDERMNKIDLANDEGLSERAHMSAKAKATDPWALPESCLVNSGGRRWQARAARRRRESERDSGASETSSRERRHNDNDDGRSGHRGEGRRRGWGRSGSRSGEEEKRRPRGRAPRDDLAQLADKYHGERDGSEGRVEEVCPKEQVDADGLDANEVSAAAMRAMLAGNMQEYERLNSLMVTKTVVVDETLKGQGALGSAGSSRAKMLSVREDNKDEDKMDVSELLRQERAGRGVRSGEYDKHLAENIRKNKRFQGSADEDEYFGATELGGGGENPMESMPAELSRERKRRYRGTRWVSEEKRRKEERGERRAARRTQRECDLCMEHSSWARNREEKLIAVSPRVYICMANYKSTLLQGQLIIVPQNHCASLRTADEETAEEIRNYQKCLVHYYATLDPPCVPVFIETVKTPPQNDDVMALLGGGAHTTMQCFPIPHDRVKELESYFRQGMSLSGDTWSNQPKIVECKGRSDVSSSGIPPSSPYMHVDFGLQVGLVHIIDKAKEFRWDYGLQTIAGMLEIDKLSLVHYDQPGNGGEEKYNKDMKVLRKAFEAFDWAKGLA
ncbi:Trichohyalin, putative [Perkinsus marinus ATCC 50983]|uniref:Trichohyalin, putative n=1 Tax=Perkinsus marinus (strain ATCC 50983 / TXsc) TaxID=423536 RepID=C5LTY2_PERM5|nr:Trichohyalin, putative [Perkinsus marinus ATCC 50983]EEQ99780.1 Trichohyalin, putative [Perkinsus marinus ATCC 50983]|eukprot:XP_002767063.1 Trichohyalin, putative [Perkinsus marinus ATCC 50983]